MESEAEQATQKKRQGQIGYFISFLLFMVLRENFGAFF